LHVLAAQGAPVSWPQLCTLLDIHPHEHEGFSRRLGAMVRDGQLLQNRRGDWLIPGRAGLMHGRIEGHPDGFGFVIPDEGEGDIFIPSSEMRKVLHGDRVIVRLAGQDRKGRPEGKIVDVTARANTRVVGRLREEHGVRWVTPENRRISQDILLAPPRKGRRQPNAQPGQVVVVELITQPDRHAPPTGGLVDILGDYADPGLEVEIALRKHDLPFEFSPAARLAALRLPKTVRRADTAGREDWTSLPWVTIDGETARDFDDAVFCERTAEGFRLWVAIADVSHYVRPEDTLDTEAALRGTSVYFPRRVIPMLPEKISNGLCSLNPQERRLAMVCALAVSNDGQIGDYRFFPAVIQSKARLTYTEVAFALYGQGEQTTHSATPLDDLLPHLRVLDEVFRALQKARAVRGAIDFETLETRMIFDDEGKIERIVPVERNDAHRLIEECMLAANVCASDFLHAHQHRALYRVHEGPTAQRLATLRDFLATFGLALGGGECPSAKDYAHVLGQMSQRPDKGLLQTVMLRSLRQAIYSPDNRGHFGLAYERYTHFTSPIRRYPDLLIHRSIKAVLAGQTYHPGDWSAIGLACSAAERRADEATRDVEAWLKCYFMQDKIGETFDGVISAVVPFGVFVALNDLFIEGLVHVSELGADYFSYDGTSHAMVGARSGRRYRLADPLRVQLVRVDLEQNKMEFKLADVPASLAKRNNTAAH
jgi:ribonuclease R